MIGWDEILEGGVTKTAVVESWRGMNGAVEASKMGNRVISAPNEFTYFDWPQTKKETKGGKGTITDLEQAYKFDPVPAGLTPEQAKSVMGAECCMWNEYVYEYEVDYKLFPRVCAFAETVWSPKEHRNFSDFSTRIDTHKKRLVSAPFNMDIFLGEPYDEDWKKTVNVSGAKLIETRDVCIGGWTPDRISNFWYQLSWDITEYVDKNGIYRFQFVNDSSETEIMIAWAALYCNGKEVARHSRLNRSNFEGFLKYSLRLKDYKPGSKYSISISVTGKSDNKTSGKVYLRYFKDSGIDIK